MAKVKKMKNAKFWRGCRTTRTLKHCWWECKMGQPLWETIQHFLKKINIPMTLQSQA